MADDRESVAQDVLLANDNQNSQQGQELHQELNQVILIVARLIGRRIAKQHFITINAANDNRRQSISDMENGADND